MAGFLMYMFSALKINGRMMHVKEIKNQKQSSHIRAIAVIFLIIVLSACKADEPIRIGFLAGTSGRVADSGISGRDAAQMAVDQCNQDGGISGKRVQLIVKDDQQQPDVARQGAGELISEGVVAIIGPMTSDMAVAVTPIANEAKVVVMSPTATTEALSGKDDYFLRVASTSSTYSHRSASYLIKSGKMRRVAVAYDLGNASFSEYWVNNFRKFFGDKGGEVIATVGFKADANRTFLEIARELLAAPSDGIVIVANSMDSALLCQQIRKIDPQIEIFLSDWGGTERLLELGGKAVEGVTLVQAFDRGSLAPRYQRFRQTYMERFQREPGFPGVNTYDAIQVILTSLRSQKAGQHLKETILSLNKFEGLQSDFTFNRFGDALRPQASISMVQNNQFVVLE